MQLGSMAFTRDSILAYAARFDPRILAAAREGGPVPPRDCTSRAR